MADNSLGSIMKQEPVDESFDFGDDKHRDKKKRRRRSRSRSHEHRRRRSRSRDRDSRRRRRSRSRSRDRSHKKSKRKHRDRSRERSNSPEKTKKPRQYKFWDKPPEGFEHVTPQQYKEMQQSGQIAMTLPGVVPGAAIAAQFPMAGGHVARQARRLYVGGIPFGATEQNMMEFFNAQMRAAGLCAKEGDPLAFYLCKSIWTKILRF